MNTKAPSKAKIAVMIAFASSCVALTLFLWLSFGGSVPYVPSMRFMRPISLSLRAKTS